MLGWGRSGATSYQPVEDSVAAVRTSVIEALADVPVSELWVAHTWPDYDLHNWLSGQGIPVAHFMRGVEWDIAFLTAGRPWGVAVHAGTGSWVHCRLPDGRSGHIGGMGPFFGDEGSGWDLGFRGIKAALRSGWSHRTRTTLATAVPEALGVRSLVRSVVGHPITSGKITRGQVASVAPAVLKEAAAGDRVAVNVVHEAAASLADMCILLMEEMDVAGQGYPLIGAAGVIQNSTFYWRVLLEKIAGHDPTLVPEIAPLKMALGVAMLAMRSAGIRVSDTLRDRIRDTQAAFPCSVVPAIAPPA